jgi:hypothetical protein
LANQVIIQTDKGRYFSVESGIAVAVSVHIARKNAAQEV